MHNIIKKTQNKIFQVSPKLVKFCIFPSKYCDYTQFNSNRIHPHARFNRGVFRESLSGYIKIKSTNWDKQEGILFSKLLEFQALKNHYTGKENWKKSKYAFRNINFIKKKHNVRGFVDHKKFLVAREKQIDKLFESIIKKGVYPININRDKKLFIDNISVVLTKKNKLYFNNRGHHRLSIAKIIGLKEVPIKITVAKSTKILEEFYLLNK